MTNLSEAAGRRCGDYFREGYNCAEAIFLGFQELVLPNVDRDLARSLTGFGGGIGRAGCVCGALAGAVMVLGLFAGRTTNDAAGRKRAYKHVADLYESFTTNFSSTCCRLLSPYPQDSKERRENCLNIVSSTARLLMEQLLAGGLVTANKSNPAN